jgi:opacity protein-like surface antigen
MKNLITSLFFIVGLIAYNPSQLNAQTYLGVGLRTGIPTGDFADYAGFGLGGGVEIAHMVSDNASIGFTAGYMAFLENDFSEQVTGSSVVVPLLANVRYGFGDSDLQPFVGLGLGYTLVEQTIEYDLSDFGGDVNEFDESYGGFTINPHLGLRYMPSDNMMVFLSADYNYIFNEAEVEVVSDSDPVTGGANVVALDPYAYIGINLGVAFGIGN